MTTISAVKTLGQENWATLAKLSKDQPALLPTLGVVTLAAVTGGVTGVVLAKGLLATRGVAAIKAALAAKGVVATKAALAAKGATAAQGGAHAAGLLNIVTSGGAAALNGANTLISSMTTGGAALGDKVMLLVVNTLTHDTVPITVGAVTGVVVGMVSGGFMGVSALQRQMRSTETRLHEQMTQTAVFAAEATRLQDALAAMAAQPNAAPAPGIEQPAVATTATPAQDRLEELLGIGPVFASRLNAGGIFTFADLAAQTPEQLLAIVAPGRSGLELNPQAWIDEARQRVAGG